jgi:hypothetical protein
LGLFEKLRKSFGSRLVITDFGEDFGDLQILEKVEEEN